MAGIPSQTTLKAFALLLLVLGLAACGQMRDPSATRVISYTVKPGDTLYSISWRYGYDHRKVAAWNLIPAPYTIKVGQVIRIIPAYQQTVRTGPTPAEQAAAAQPASDYTRPQPRAPAPASKPATTAPATSSSTSPSPTRPTTPTPTTRPAPRPAPPAPAPVVRKDIAWHWPAQGQQKYPFKPVGGKKGIGIAGKLGQSIHAAADGEVVYSGSGLIGYGNLLIIKHDDIYLSAYGHNRRLLVQEGAKVKRGQKIAEMGESSRDGALLHFEIRRDGSPVNPRIYLPKSGS